MGWLEGDQRTHAWITAAMMPSHYVFVFARSALPAQGSAEVRVGQHHLQRIGFYDSLAAVDAIIGIKAEKPTQFVD